MHQAAFAALGMPHTYERLETPADELGRRVDALRSGVFAGLNVTVPHKRAVLAFVDEVDATASATGAANTLVRLHDGRVRAYNTDTLAVADELRRLAKSDDALKGATALVLGAGGAARAAVVALASHIEVGRILIRARSLAETSHAIAFVRQIDALLARSGGRGVSVALGAEGLFPPAESEEKAPRFDVIVQATTCGMHGGPPGSIVSNAVRWDRVPQSAVALDVVYTPRDTPFLERARERGLRCDDGLGMLVRQGALAFELWLGKMPPLDAMRAAIDVTLS
jgi:shikimate dehydrogenase